MLTRWLSSIPPPNRFSRLLQASLFLRGSAGIRPDLDPRQDSEPEPLRLWALPGSNGSRTPTWAILARRSNALNRCRAGVAVEREVEGDVMLSDIGQGLPLRTGVFDGAISISAIQWLCNADKTANEPRQRLKAFFQTLYRSLARGARAVLQVRL
jgi:hypothetical protein